MSNGTYVVLEGAMVIAKAGELHELVKAVWAAHGRGQLSDDEAQALAELAAARRRPLAASARVAAGKLAREIRAAEAGEAVPRGRAGSRPAHPDYLRRRRYWAASGLVPPEVAARFPVGIVAVLAVIAFAVSKHGCCDLCVAEIADKAGVSPGTVKKARRAAEALGVLSTQVRRVSYARNWPNVLRLRCRKWLSWLRRRVGRSGGTNVAASSYLVRKEGLFGLVKSAVVASFGVQEGLRSKALAVSGPPETVGAS